ncbi:MAG: hypothetical protein JKY22_11225 [Flavobacteriaceae bacterium]|nr:hypothetical protein [Flavobacteriaceae bacterium]
MKLKNTIASSLFGFLFSLAILFPSVIQFTHLFEEHEDVGCTETVHHIHEKKIECKIHDFQLTPFHFDSLEVYSELTITNYPEKDEEVTSLFYSEKTHDFLLRGPPATS